MRTLLILTLLFQMPVAMASGLFGSNKVDDTFNIKSLDAKSAIVEGTPKDLKAGDLLYSNKSPFKFTVTDIKGNAVTVALPERHELKEGMSLLRTPTDPIKKAIKTEAKLKQALED